MSSFCFGAMAGELSTTKRTSTFVRAMAADSFKLMDTEAKAAVPALLEAAKDKVAEVRKKAIASLECIDPEAAKKAKP